MAFLEGEIFYGGRSHMPAHIPMVPYGFPKRSNNPTFNLYDRLLQDRLIFINKPVDSDLASQTMAAMLYLNAEEADSDIQLHIHSQGSEGQDSPTAGLAIYDTMQCLSSSVTTVCAGAATGMAAFLLAMGAPNKRLALPHARILLSQPHPFMQEGSVSNIDTEAEEYLKLQRLLAELLAERTGQSVEKVLKDTERSLYLSAQAALDYGLIDHIVNS
ncbi:MAG: ATP-dependent Clp protease proteolytic subunit [Cyanobacteria bacterium J06634_6]